MIRPAPLTRPICPMCGEPGIHANTSRCIEALRAEIDTLKTIKIRKTEPSQKYLGRYYPGFYP